MWILNAEKNTYNSNMHVWKLNFKKSCYFSLETSLKHQSRRDKKSDSRSWNKGRCHDSFEVDWGVWNALNLTSEFSRIFTATKSDKQQLGKASWICFCFKTENLIVSLKTSWNKQSLEMCPFPSETSHGQKASIFINLCPAADAACCSLQ